jgi:hypothetical protein
MMTSGKFLTLFISGPHPKEWKMRIQVMANEVLANEVLANETSVKLRW